MMSLERDLRAITDRIRENQTAIKILLKTRNETLLLSRWISHYMHALGAASIIIADNQSDKQATADIYNGLPDGITIFTYAGFHNEIHNRSKHSELYDAIEDSCDYAIALDTDEFLVLTDGVSWSWGKESVNLLEQINPGRSIPSLMLINIFRSEDRFECPSVSGLSECLRWGKPLISSRQKVRGGQMIHNCQFPGAVFAPPARIALALLHMTTLYPEERLRANRQKLFARGLVKEEQSFIEISTLDTSAIKDPVAIRCINEVTSLLQKITDSEIKEPQLSHLKLLPNGSIRYSEDDTRRRFVSFVELSITHQASILETKFELATSASVNILSATREASSTGVDVREPSQAAADASVIMSPRMSNQEEALFKALLSTGRQRYAEFGCGGSTLLAHNASFEAIVGVESDLAWCSMIRRNPIVAQSLASGRTSILHADIGPVGAWGTPVDDRSTRSWPRYLKAMWGEWARRHSSPDMVFVDGRFRVACCISVALISQSLYHNDRAPLVLLHDFDEARPSYGQVLNFFHEEEREGSLIVLTPKQRVSPEILIACLADSILETL
jgi:hypothetical protein